MVVFTASGRFNTGGGPRFHAAQKERFPPFRITPHVPEPDVANPGEAAMAETKAQSCRGHAAIAPGDPNPAAR